MLGNGKQNCYYIILAGIEIHAVGGGQEGSSVVGATNLPYLSVAMMEEFHQLEEVDEPPI